MTERYLIEMTCIDDGNEWGLSLGQKVYFTQVGAFALNPFDATIRKTQSMLSKFIEEIIDEGNFMPQIRKITFVIE